MTNQPATTSRPLRAAVVGAGPAGFFCAAELLDAFPGADVAVFDRCWAPYGLVRYGVAPDHGITRRVTRMFEQTAARPGFSFRGGVQVGRDLSVDELGRFFDATVIATGARGDRALGIPGEDLPGVHRSVAFAGWVNGDPDFAHEPIDLSCETAAVIGNGNVALDVARLLARNPEDLAATDIAAPALAALRRSRIRSVIVAGRRGPVQSSFSADLLAEIGALPGCSVHVHPSAIELNEESREELIGDGTGRRDVCAALAAFAAHPPAPAGRTVAFEFLALPFEIVGPGRASALHLERAVLEGPTGAQRARPGGDRFLVQAGLVITAAGHAGLPLPGVPFDEARRLVPTDGARVVREGRRVPGLYAAGWARRGAHGLIGHNRRDAMETARAICEDLPALPPCPVRDPAGLDALLAARGVRPVTWDDWKRIDAEELRRDSAEGRDRARFASQQDALGWMAG